MFFLNYGVMPARAACLADKSTSKKTGMILISVITVNKFYKMDLVQNNMWNRGPLNLGEADRRLHLVIMIWYGVQLEGSS